MAGDQMLATSKSKVGAEFVSLLLNAFLIIDQRWKSHINSLLSISCYKGFVIFVTTRLMENEMYAREKSRLEGMSRVR